MSDMEQFYSNVEVLERKGALPPLPANLSELRKKDLEGLKTHFRALEKEFRTPNRTRNLEDMYTEILFIIEASKQSPLLDQFENLFNEIWICLPRERKVEKKANNRETEVSDSTSKSLVRPDVLGYEAYLENQSESFCKSLLERLDSIDLRWDKEDIEEAYALGFIIFYMHAVYEDQLGKSLKRVSNILSIKREGGESKVLLFVASTRAKLDFTSTDDNVVQLDSRR